MTGISADEDEDEGPPTAGPSDMTLLVPPRLDQVRVRHLTRISIKNVTSEVDSGTTPLLEIYTGRSQTGYPLLGPGLDLIIDEEIRGGNESSFGFRLWSSLDKEECLGDWMIEDARYLPRWDPTEHTTGLLPVITMGHEEFAILDKGWNNADEKNTRQTPFSTVGSAKAKPGYDIEDVITLLDHQVSLDQVDRDEMYWREECHRLLEKSIIDRLELQIAIRRKRIEEKRASRERVSRRLDLARKECDRCARNNDERAEQLAKCRLSQKSIAAGREGLQAEVSMHGTLLRNLRVSGQRLGIECLRRLSVIYPIEDINPSTMSICGVTLSPGKIEAGTSTGLGHLAHMLQLVALYQGVYMIYPIICMGSRSGIKDPISVTNVGNGTFPLYPKGTDRYRFDYAVFLLGKDIEQICQISKVPVKDVRNLVLNLSRFLNHQLHDAGEQGVKVL